MLPFLMMPMPFEEAVEKYTEIAKKMAKGSPNLSHLREEDLEIGVTPKEVVYREDKVVLYRFKPVVEQPLSIPVLMVYALINRPLIVDLQENRSLVANLLKLGLDIYLIDWGYPTRADRWLTLDDYINGYLNNCVDFIRTKHNLDKINLLGICQGGIFTLCYSAIYQEKVKNLIVMIAPVDFKLSNTLLNMQGGCTLRAEAFNVDLMVDALGNIPGEYLNFEFVRLKPWQLGIQKYIDFIDIMDDEDKLINFLRMEKWIFDSPDLAGETYRQFLKDFYQENKLIKGEVIIGDNQINLGDIQLPVLNLYAEKDHLVPPASSLALEKYIGTKDYTVHSFPVGHIGMYVSSKVQQHLPPVIAEWLKIRS
ncbi:class III poly(R)-hydroxyalkanoic acid synthase subunit PhaC [Crocosphaera sp. XPORK-15E]|uniref:class III poly(R)-hydroxyalkanoic acid synthase subunit PhaC n=1 Tax=Crocosphaera sp. XPORK-15E TaxID=3110247 RepID=UPI002B201291|nr:class III poly(R)-hydroxyalkanoic acid synthase subunit PhaC [Crocosphaera sp. XPORK-15E]MEA5534423.1 class III poly(R)-hydroxyalkanoic acid synthase subunit PhaC [Crocosphaera sp. XPORK-15E]